MTLRQKLAVSAAPVILRLLLAVSFLWIGLGRIMDSIPVQGEQAALLANLGGLDAPPQSAGGSGEPKAEWTAADFPEPVRARRAMTIALRIHASAYPAPDDLGTPRRPLWPEAMAGGRAPVVLAWVVTLTELSAGVFLLLGLLTRLWAAALLGVLLGAIWLTEIGPALQAERTVLGLLPDRAAYSVDLWRNLMWQLGLLMSALALLLAGPGAGALDNTLFRRRGDDDDA